MKSFLFLLIFILSFEGQACPSYLRAYPRECEMNDEYSRLKETFHNEHGLNIEYLTGYRAQRLIDRKVWEEEADRIRCRPEKAYLPSPDVWINWEKGAQFMNEALIDQKLRGENFSLDQSFIEAININSVNIKVMSGFSAMIKGARPGKIRAPGDLAPSFLLKCWKDEITRTDLEVLDDYDLKDSAGNPLVSTYSLLISESITECPGTDSISGHIYYTPSDQVGLELNKLMSFADEKFNEFIRGSGSPDYSPMDFIADFQRWFVAIHPFGDGNGRTSRFLQDYLLSKFGLPFAPGGRIQNDVLMEKGAYQNLFKDEMELTIEMLKGCEEEIKAIGTSTPEDLSCECRPMYQGEYIPESLNLSVAGSCDEARAIGTDAQEENSEFLFGIIYHLQNVSNLD